MRVVEGGSASRVDRMANIRSFLFAALLIFVGRQTCSWGGLQAQTVADPFLAENFWHKIGTAKPAVESSASLALLHSFGLLNETNANWEVLRQKAISTSWYGIPDKPLENVADAAYWNRHNMNPNFDCPQLVKVGGSESGETKFVCNPQRLMYAGKEGGCLIYSFGCAGDFKFEDAINKMHGKGCEIHVFDPAKAWERPGDAENKNIHYHAWGLSSSYDESKSVVWPKGRGGEFKTFPETLNLLGHNDRPIDVLKIDCEGCEWSTYKDWIGLDIRQILIETHGVPTPQGTPKARWYKKPLDISDYFNEYKKHGYALFHKDPNKEISLELCFIKLHDDFWNQPADWQPFKEDELLPTTDPLLTRGLRRTSGEGWRINPSPNNLLPYDYQCLWIDFESTTGNRAKFCGHNPPDKVTGDIQAKKRFHHCDVLPQMWKNADKSDDSIYLEIGANIGSCVMEMLLSTDAKIIAFEPHPKNLFVMMSTIQALDKSLQDRVVIVPVALGAERVENATIYAAEGNMGNSIVGTIIKDNGRQEFKERDQHKIPVERLDSVISPDVNVAFSKMDAQGFECNILSGWSQNLANRIRKIKFEVAPKWLRRQECHDLFSRFRNLGFALEKNGQLIESGETDQFKGMVEIVAFHK